MERIAPDGSHEILFANGTRKQISADGKTIIVSFFNGDIKQILGDGRVVKSSSLNKQLYFHSAVAAAE